MGSAVALLASSVLAAILGWSLGTRRERGRYARLREIERQERQLAIAARRRKGGVVLRPIKTRRTVE